MILDLTTRKLITSKQQDNREVFSVHRLLQHRLLQDLDDNVQDREEIFHLAFELIRERLPRPSMDGNDSVGWTAFREYLPHVLTLQRIFDSGTPILTPFVMLAELFRDSGVYLGQRGQIYDGLRLLNSAEAILDRLNCEEDQLRIDIHIATALLIQYFGISHRAESSRRFRKILEIRQKLAGQAQPGTISKAIEITTYNSRADYGNSLLQFNNYKDAEPIYQECHAKYQEWGSEDEMYFEHAKFNHHMAYCRMYHHDFDEAIRLSSKAVDLISRHMGQPQLIMRYEFDLACIILQSGDIERALVMQDKILRKRLTLQGNGKASYFTLQSYYAVGAAHAHLKNWDQAE
jgi:tetratricopeptide (TPR) repeat protein